MGQNHEENGVKLWLLCRNIGKNISRGGGGDRLCEITFGIPKPIRHLDPTYFPLDLDTSQTRHYNS